MAVLAKKIHIKNSAGTEQTVNLYSTTGELGTASGYTFQTVDGVTAYAPLVSTTHAKATSGRVLKNGTTYAWGSSAPAPAYGAKLFTSTGTFTVPAGVTKVRVTLVGGGAGGADCVVPNDAPNAGNYATNATYDYQVRTTGGTSSFGSYASAAGATGPKIRLTKRACKVTSGSRDNQSSTSYSGWNHANCCSSDTEEAWKTCAPQVVSNGGGTSVVGTTWHYTLAGASAVALTNYQGTVAHYAGAGGRADSETDRSYGKPGNSGYKTVKTVAVSAGQTITCTVGGGGPVYFYGKYYSYNIANDGTPSGRVDVGGAGAIYVEWGQGIE